MFTQKGTNEGFCTQGTLNCHQQGSLSLSLCVVQIKGCAFSFCSFLVLVEPTSLSWAIYRAIIDSRLAVASLPMLFLWSGYTNIDPSHMTWWCTFAANLATCHCIHYRKRRRWQSTGQDPTRAFRMIMPGNATSFLLSTEYDLPLFSRSFCFLYTILLGMPGAYVCLLCCVHSLSHFAVAYGSVTMKAATTWLNWYHLILP